MITKYKIYENIKTELSIEKLLSDIISELNNESFKLIYTLRQVNFYKGIEYKVYYKSDSFLNIYLHDNYLSLIRYGSDDFYDVSYKNIDKNTIKEKILMSYILHHLELLFIFDINDNYNKNINLENNLEGLITEMLNSKYNIVIIMMLKDKLLTKELQVKYNYLIDANKFDLI